MIYVLFDVPTVVWVDQSKSVHKISEDLNLDPASELIVFGGLSYDISTVNYQQIKYNFWAKPISQRSYQIS